jgi:DNA-binding transcriptional ArsR family regulator
MKTQAENLFRKKCRFEVSLRYELFYSLNILLDPNSRIHPQWRKANPPGREFDKLLGEIGGSWEVWPVLASLLPGPLSNPSFEEIITGLRRLGLKEFREKILRGLIHSEEAIAPLLKKRASLKSAISKVPRTKREWIGHIGLYPYDPASPQVIALEKLLADTDRFREIVLRLLEIYWEKKFKTTWDRLVPQLKRSLEERERLFSSCSFAEFSKQALLRIEVDESKGEIHAIRGAYRLRFQDIETCHFLPSAFNDRRFWSAFKDDSEKTTVYFPYFDPSITLDLQLANAANDTRNTKEAALDPALIFKALGDSTRFAIAQILARAPKSSVELARLLSVSKPTISHHVHLLREAGLIEEKYVAGSVELELRRPVLENLSQLTIAKLFHSDEPLNLTRTRGGALT